MSFWVCFLLLISGCFQDEQAKGKVQIAGNLPTSQEEMLAELLAELPEDRRAKFIARALANSRQDEQSANDSAPSATQVEKEEDLSDTLERVRTEQQKLAKELLTLRGEFQKIRNLVDVAARQWHRDSIVPPQTLSKRFVLPQFQRPGISTLPGPYVNQPSGPMIVLQPAPETEEAINLELAQLSRDMFRLNQRLQQLQGHPEIAPAPMVLNRPSKESAEQAKRPSPLLPR